MAAEGKTERRKMSLYDTFHADRVEANGLPSLSGSTFARADSMRLVR
jgi:hypothetical protein